MHPSTEVEWLSNLLPDDLYVVKYVGDREAHSRLALWPQGYDLWVGLPLDDDVYPEDLRCRRPDSGPRRASPVCSFRGLLSRERLRELIRDAKGANGLDDPSLKRIGLTKTRMHECSTCSGMTKASASETGAAQFPDHRGLST